MASSHSLLTASALAPRVSVIMPVYNGARYLSQAMESILTQTFSDLEFVIVDDGSTDDTPRVLESCTDPRVVLVVNERNLGLTRSLNRGIGASHGELVARQDADDVSLPERLAIQVAYMDAHPPVALVGSGSRWIDEQGTAIREWIPIAKPAEIQQLLLDAVPFLHGTFMIRRDCLAQAGGYNEQMPVAQDCDLLLRLSERWDIANVPEVLYEYRCHGDSVTHSRKPDQERYLRLAQEAAIRRRLEYGRGRVGLSKTKLPDWVETADRRWLARRFTWWSAASRRSGRGVALKFLVLALLLDAATPETWSYIGGIVARKARSHPGRAAI